MVEILAMEDTIMKITSQENPMRLELVPNYIERGKPAKFGH